MDAIPLGIIFLLTCLLAGLAIEAGHRIGRWRHSRTVEENETPVGAMVASILGLLAFFLAFTFGMAGTHFEAREQAILNEARALRTAYLRARLLPEPHRSASEKLLREYTDDRVRGVQERKVQESIDRSQGKHDRLWAEAVQAAASHPSPITALYLQSLNELIELHAVRVQVGLRGRVPRLIWAKLIAMAVLGMAAAGYQSGLSSTRRSPAMLGLILAFAGAIFLIAELDRPGEGMLANSQEAIIDVQKAMREAHN